MTENEAIKELKAQIETAESMISYNMDFEPNHDNSVLENKIKVADMSISALEEIQQYRAIGTVEECREAMERQMAKKPVEYEDKYYACPVCDNVLMYKWEKYPSQLKDKKCGLPYCLSCGQAIDWYE